MASDNHANYGRIGFTVFLGAFALAISLIYIAGIGNRKNEFLVETYYDNPVSGLSVGSPVNFRGVKIGEVKEIAFVGAVYDDDEMETNDYQRVIIVMALDCRRLDIEKRAMAEQIVRKFVAAGIHATIASNAVTGMSRVEFNIPPNPLPAAELKWKPRYIQIPPQPSLLESLSLSVTKTLNTFNKMDLGALCSNITEVATSTAELTRNISDVVQAEKIGMNRILRNVESATTSIDELAEKLRDNPSLLIRSPDPDPLPETK